MKPMEEKAFYHQLVERYMKNQASDEELEVFFHLQQQGVLDEYIIAYMDQLPDDAGKEIPVKRPALRRMWLAAAVIGAILLAGGGFYLMQQREGPPSLVENTATLPEEIPPGSDNAVLTLADGSTITLDSTGAGSLSKQGHTIVMKQAGGKLAYQVENEIAGIVQYNTLTTPKGGKYEVILPDGTAVLLNAASSLRFPVAFPGKEREVVLNGEAFFEVAPDASKPFRVRLLQPDGAPERTVEVLGTSFNIMAYHDEPFIKTTLVTGSVKVTSRSRTAMLSPGQQAVMDRALPEDIRVGKASLEEAIAWKNNEFYFSNTDIYSIMRQLSRWYNVEISYEDSLRVFLNGNIRKSVDASQVFRMLELTGEVHFSTAGRKVTVSGRR